MIGIVLFLHMYISSRFIDIYLLNNYVSNVIDISIIRKLGCINYYKNKNNVFIKMRFHHKIVHEKKSHLYSIIKVKNRMNIIIE